MSSSPYNIFFKNLLFYRLAAGWDMSPGTLEVALARQPLLACTGMRLMSRGWVSPLPEGGLVESVERHLLIALGVESKVLPTSVVKKEVAERAKTLEEQQGYKPGKKQLRDLMERITAELLPRAFAKRRVTRAWIDPVNRWLVVDASSAARAEELLEHLRNTLGELPVTRLETETSPQGAMTQWLTIGDAPGQFALDSDCELKGTGEEAATVRYRRHDLAVKEIREHISGGKLATSLGLIWKERMSFVLHEPMQIRRLKSLAMESDSAPPADQTPADMFAADFLLLTGEVVALLADLLKALGGEKDPAAAPEAQPPQPVADKPKVPPTIYSGDTELDPLYNDAVKIVRAEGKASVSFIQRKLMLGYNRAARLIERMEVEGVVGHCSQGGNFPVLASQEVAADV